MIRVPLRPLLVYFCGGWWQPVYRPSGWGGMSGKAGLGREPKFTSRGGPEICQAWVEGAAIEYMTVTELFKRIGLRPAGKLGQAWSP